MKQRAGECSRIGLAEEVGRVISHLRRVRVCVLYSCFACFVCHWICRAFVALYAYQQFIVWLMLSLSTLSCLWHNMIMISGARVVLYTARRSRRHKTNERVLYRERTTKRKSISSRERYPRSRLCLNTHRLLNLPRTTWCRTTQRTQCRCWVPQAREQRETGCPGRCPRPLLQWTATMGRR